MSAQTSSTLKVCVLGAGGVGKSALTVRFTQGLFVSHYDPTIEDSYRKPVEIDGVHYRSEILDTAGTEAFGAMRDLYYKDAEAFILVYSLAARSTFQDVQDMRDAIVRVKDSEKFCSVLVANKCDLPADQWAISHEEGVALAARWTGCTYMESSAKDDLNVTDAFITAMKKIIEERSGIAGTGNANNTKKAARREKGCTLF